MQSNIETAIKSYRGLIADIFNVIINTADDSGITEYQYDTLKFSLPISLADGYSIGTLSAQFDNDMYLTYAHAKMLTYKTLGEYLEKFLTTDNLKPVYSYAMVIADASRILADTLLNDATLVTELTTDDIDYVKSIWDCKIDFDTDYADFDTIDAMVWNVLSLLNSVFHHKSEYAIENIADDIETQYGNPFTDDTKLYHDTADDIDFDRQYDIENH
jgi:hypothetical protein